MGTASMKIILYLSDGQEVSGYINAILLPKGVEPEMLGSLITLFDSPGHPHFWIVVAWA
jgi:hypothetical protein